LFGSCLLELEHDRSKGDADEEGISIDVGERIKEWRDDQLRLAQISEIEPAKAIRWAIKVTAGIEDGKALIEAVKR
jgi:hypothetical protein